MHEDLHRPLLEVFDSWLKNRPAKGRHAAYSGALREESANIYRDMWTSFVHYCIKPGSADDGAPSRRLNPLQALTREDLLEFLGRSSAPTRDTELSDRYAWRMLHLIERVLEHAPTNALTLTSTVATRLLREAPFVYANARQHEPATEVLCPQEFQQLQDTLCSVLPPASPSPWKVLRDGAAAALMLGAGLAPGDVRALHLSDLGAVGAEDASLSREISVPADGSSPRHRSPVSDWAAPLLDAWLSARADMKMPGAWAFPSTAAGKPWSHQACHVAITRVLTQASIVGGNPFRLRHTFALRQMTNGCPDETLAGWLGLIDLAQLKRYRDLLPPTCVRPV